MVKSRYYAGKARVDTLNSSSLVMKPIVPKPEVKLSIIDFWVIYDNSSS